MLRLPLSLLQILFLTRVTSIEHYWVILSERRGTTTFPTTSLSSFSTSA
jgi:hypothetical protein